MEPSARVSFTKNKRAFLRAEKPLFDFLLAKKRRNNYFSGAAVSFVFSSFLSAEAMALPAQQELAAALSVQAAFGAAAVSLVI
jgi:hypothetical protein